MQLLVQSSLQIQKLIQKGKVWNEKKKRNMFLVLLIEWQGHLLVASQPTYSSSDCTSDAPQLLNLPQQGINHVHLEDGVQFLQACSGPLHMR